MTILQSINAQQLDGAVSQLTESSIQLAEAAANFGALKLMFGVFLVFIMVMLLFFVYQMITYNKKLVDIHRSASKIEDYFEDTAKKSLGKSQASLLIRRSFSSLAQNVKYNILRIRLESKSGHDTLYRDHIVSRITSLVNYECSELQSFLASFECEGSVISDGISPEDSQLISDFMVEQVFQSRESFSISTMDQAVDILLNGIKLSVLKRI